MALFAQKSGIRRAQQHRDHLENAGHNKNRKDGCNAAAQCAQNIIQNHLGRQLFLFAIAGRSLFFRLGQAAQLVADFVIYTVNSLTDDHLDLVSCVNHFDYACYLVNGIIAGFGFVFQVEAQARHAVGYGCNISFAAYGLDYFGGHFGILELSHTDSPYF